MKLTLEEFVTSGAHMAQVAGLVINPTIYRNIEIAQIITDINNVLLNNNSPLRIMPAPGKVNYLRFEEERLDKVLYILSCLVDYETIKT
jgi:hypothetical protein